MDSVNFLPRYKLSGTVIKLKLNIKTSVDKNVTLALVDAFVTVLFAQYFLPVIDVKCLINVV